MSQLCQWAQDGEGNWDTECGELFVMNECTPSENDMRFCCYCGCLIDEVLYRYGD